MKLAIKRYEEQTKREGIKKNKKEGSVLFNDALNTFSYGYMALAEETKRKEKNTSIHHLSIAY